MFTRNPSYSYTCAPKCLTNKTGMHNMLFSDNTGAYKPICVIYMKVGLEKKKTTH